MLYKMTRSIRRPAKPTGFRYLASFVALSLWLALLRNHIRSMLAVTKKDKYHVNFVMISTQQQISKHHFLQGDEVVHVPFDNLKYRRVCANISEISVLCMTVRYPFNVSLQDPTVSYPKPVADGFYNLRKSGFMFVDGTALDDCQKQYIVATNSSTRNANGLPVHHCMEHLAKVYADTVLVLFTRQRHRSRTSHGMQKEEWYGVAVPSQKVQQQRRTQSFFRNHLILVLGASPTTSVVNCLVSIFGKCKFHNRFHYSCGGSNRGKATDEEKLITLQIVRYEPTEHKPNLTSATLTSRDLALHVRHLANDTPPLLQLLQSPLHNILQHRWHSFHHLNDTGTQPRLRPLSVMIEYPIAHMQTENMLLYHPGLIQYNQERYMELIMNITTPLARQELRNMGFDLKRVILMDGLPQHFPTRTGAFLEHIATTRNESAFLQFPYPEWQPEYGSTCRGPIPANSLLTTQVHGPFRRLWAQRRDHAVNDAATSDIHYWHAPLWEFANQFWWQEIMWSSSANPRLDCVHAVRQKTGLTCVHKYFLQALIDDNDDGP